MRGVLGMDNAKGIGFDPQYQVEASLVVTRQIATLLMSVQVRPRSREARVGKHVSYKDVPKHIQPPSVTNVGASPTPNGIRVNRSRTVV